MGMCECVCVRDCEISRTTLAKGVCVCVCVCVCVEKEENGEPVPVKPSAGAEAMAQLVHEAPPRGTAAPSFFP